MVLRVALVLLFFFVLALAWAALDNITTDRTASDFTLEYAMLAVSVPILVGLLWAGWREWRAIRRRS